MCAARLCIGMHSVHVLYRGWRIAVGGYAEGDCTQADGIGRGESTAHCAIPGAIGVDVRGAVAGQRRAHEQWCFVQTSKERGVSIANWIGTRLEVESTVMSMIMCAPVVCSATSLTHRALPLTMTSYARVWLAGHGMRPRTPSTAKL